LGADDWIRIREELPNDGLRRVLVLWGAVPVPFFRAFAAFFLPLFTQRRRRGILGSSR
jgi:hypothetical protein